MNSCNIVKFRYDFVFSLLLMFICGCKRLLVWFWQ